MSRKRSAEPSPEIELEKSFERWEHLKTYGGNDPFWEDGVNMNLVRNHILHYKKGIEQAYPDGNYPEIYYRETPPEVDQNYMARADEIRENARKALETYKVDKDYQYLLRHRHSLSPKESKRICLENVLWYVSGLEKYIATDSLVDMRRHEHARRYTESFSDCAEKLKDALENAEITLFSLISESEQDDDEDEGFNMSM